MKKFLSVLLVGAFLSVMGAARQTDATAILDKAITALGGAEKLGKIKGMNWKAKGTFSFQGNENPVTLNNTSQGIDHMKQEFEAEFDGNKFRAISVLAGDKGWRIFGDMKNAMDNIPNEKRGVYLTLLPITLVQLKDEKLKFKLEALPDEKIGEKAVTTLKVTPADGKDFKINFDKETGLPVRTVARLLGLQGEEYTQETLYSEYKELAGIQKATKQVVKRDGEKFIDLQITEFVVLDKEADPKTFAEP